MGAVAKLLRPRLATKLMLGLIGMSLLAVFISGLAYRLSSGPAFSQLVVDEAQEHFVSDVTAYYRQTGKLDGLGDWLAAGRGMLVNGAPPINAAPAGGIVAFGLADPSGIVVLDGGRVYVEGQRAPAEALKRSKPIVVDGRTIGLILYPPVDLPPNNAQIAYSQRINTALAWAAVVGLLAALGIGFLMARSIVWPVRRLTAAAQQMADSRLAQTVPAKGADELAELTGAFNRMSHDLARYEQARRQMAADIAHELRTPLTTITGYVEAMRDGELKATPERLDSVYRQAVRLARIIEDLRLLSMADVGELPLTVKRISLDELVVESVRAHQVAAEHKGVRLQAELPTSLPDLDADPGRLQQVIEILVSNALRHTDDGQVVVSAHAHEGAAVIRVSDTGTGIDPELLPRLFDRFYRGHEARVKDGRGSGLGLAIAKAIISAHEGVISVSSELGVGTVFTIRLPMSTFDAAVMEETPLPQAVAAGS